MDTNLLNVIPEKWRNWLLIVLAVSPYITRSFHALANGGGIRGVFAAIWLGTNTPAAPQATESKSQLRLPLMLLLGILAVTQVTGCIAPGNKSVLAEMSKNLANDHATLTTTITTPWGMQKVVRANPNTNQNVVIAPDGTVTINSLVFPPAPVNAFQSQATPIPKPQP